MSQKVGEIYYDVDLDTGKLIDGQRKVQRAMSDMGDQGDMLAAKMSAVGLAISSMLAAGAIVAQLERASESAKRFEAAIDNLSAITGATGKDLKFLETTAKEFGNTTSASSLQAVEAMKLIASAKPELLENATALKAVTAQAVILADASGMTLPQAADSLTLALNQMGAGADQAGRFINVMAAGAKFGASEIAQSSEALKQFAVSARGVGLSIEEANAGIQALAAVGIKGGEAGTALRNVLLKLETETDQKLKPSINGLAGALDNLAKKNLDTASLTKMFGLENINATNALMGSTDQIRLLTTQLTGTQTATEQAATNTDNYAGSIKRMQNALENAYIEMGTKFNPILKDGADLITNLAIELSNGSSRIDIAMTAISTAAVVAAGSLSGPLVVGLYASVRAMTAATVAARVFSSVMAVLGGPVGIAITALGLLVLNWDKIAGHAKTAAEVSEDAAKRIAGALAKSSDKAGQDLSAQLSEAEKGLAAINQRLSEKSKPGIYGTVASPEFIKNLEEQRDAYMGVIADIKKAKNTLVEDIGPWGGEGKKGPPKKAGGVASKTKPDKFDDAGYLESLRKKTATELEKIAITEAADIRRNDALLSENKISRQTHEAALTVITRNAALDRKAIADKELADAQELEKNAAAFFKDKMAAADEREKRRSVAKSIANIGTLQIKAQGGGLQDQENLVRAQGAADMDDAETKRVEAARILDLEGMQIYADQKVAIETEMNAKIMAMREAANQSAMSSTAAIFGSLVSITKNAAGEQSGIYQVMFAAQKAFSIAQSIVAIQTGIANAASMPWPANLGAMASVAAATASIVSTIAGTNVQGRQYGGPANSGNLYRVNEKGAPEMFTAGNGKQYMMPTQSGRVTAADKVGSGNVVIFNNGRNPIGQATQETKPNGDRAIYINDAIAAVNAAMSDPNSSTSRAMGRNFSVQRSR